MFISVKETKHVLLQVVKQHGTQRAPYEKKEGTFEKACGTHIENLVKSFYVITTNQ